MSIAIFGAVGPSCITVRGDVMERCENCGFWAPLDEGDPVGKCMRNPPTLNIAQVIALRGELAEGSVVVFDPDWWVQPCTEKTSWCGEFKSRNIRW